MKRFTLPFALGAFSLFGCSDQGAYDLTEKEQAEIVGGMLSSPEHDAVVAITAQGAGCTGTLIAPTVVLTALHCVAEYDPRFRFNCEPDGTLPPGSTVGQLGELLAPRGVSVRTGVNLDGPAVRAKALYGTGSTDACHDDLAVVVLESAPDIGDAALVPLRFSRPTRKGELARVIGYGDVEQTETQRGRQVRSDVVVRGIGGPDAETPGDAGALPRTITVGEGPCHGDSGGPLFSQETGAQIGVYSLLQQSTCSGPSARNTYTNVAYFEPLIRMALESEGLEPLLEPEEPVVGAGGEGGAPSGSGGETGSVAGSSTSGGSGGSGATGGTTGDSASGGQPDDWQGSGSFKDDTCACRVAGGGAGTPWLRGGSALVLALGAAVRRRARRRRG